MQEDVLGAVPDDFETKGGPRYVIRRMRLAHCKLGPSRCEKCRAMDTERICLLDVRPPNAGKLQRRIIELKVDDETVWREYDIVKTFDSEQDAMTYAAANAIEDVQLS